ncbi:hypothetical protein [Streptomyces olivaceus]|uniref:hypothetical protein n=1 Tax=Streptomyces olivaceus TaxID=47716 RepID=UPI003669BF52
MRDSDDGFYDSLPNNEDGVALFRRCIEVGHGEDFWLLDPTDVGPDGEWAEYEFPPGAGVEKKYLNFFELFHNGYKKMRKERGGAGTSVLMSTSGVKVTAAY